MKEKILVTRSSMPTLEEYVEEIRSIFDSALMNDMVQIHEKRARGIFECH